MKTAAQYLSEASLLPIEDIHFMNENQIIRPSEAIEAINAARREAIEECANIIKDDLTEEFATQTVNRVLKLIDELK